MKTVGIIAEYNPFHNGHAYQIETVRRQTGADYIIVAMSGDFVQRGAPAILDKHTRARMALACGADLIIGLPVLWSTASAEDFATAGVLLLQKTGCVDLLCFGAETADLPLLFAIADILTEEPPAFRAALSAGLKRGMGFAAAREAAVAAFMADARAGRDTAWLPDNDAKHGPGCSSERGAGCGQPFSADIRQITDVLRSPNNILAIEYLKALKKYPSQIRPFVLERKGAAYHDTQIYAENCMDGSGADGRCDDGGGFRATDCLNGAGAGGRSRDGGDSQAMDCMDGSREVGRSDSGVGSRPTGCMDGSREVGRSDSGVGALPAAPAASASAIRQLLLSHRTGRPGMRLPVPPSADDASLSADPQAMPPFSNETAGRLAASMPPAALTVLSQALCEKPLLDADDFSALTGYRLLSADIQELSGTAGCTEAVANRLYRQRYRFTSVSSFLAQNKTRETAYTRLARILLHLTLRLTKEDETAGQDAGYITWLRILGFRRDAAPLLTQLKQRAAVPVLTKLADADRILGPDARALLQKDIFAGELYRQTQGILTARKKPFSCSELSQALVIYEDPAGAKAGSPGI